MTQTSSEPTLSDIAAQLDRLTNDVEQLTNDVVQLKSETEKSNIRVDTYQKASTQVVNLAFSLIASATVTLIVTSIFRK